MTQNYISIKQVLDNLYAHPLLEDLSSDRVVNYTQEFMRIVGSPVLFSEHVEFVDIKEHRGVLPCDCISIIQVRGEHGEEYKYTTDNFYSSRNHGRTSDIYYTYKVQGNVIYTSIKEGKIEIAYKSIETDEDGYPLVIDNASFIKALELYIKKQWFTILFDMGKIHQSVLQHTNQEYAFYVGQAQNSLISPSLDELENICNMLDSMRLYTTSHKNGYKYIGADHSLKVH